MSLSQFSNIAFSQFSERLSLDRLRSDAGSLTTRMGSIRPPQEFFDFRRLSKPENFGEIQSRVGYNLGYFSSNYALIAALFFVYALITNLLLLFVIIFVVLGVLGINKLHGEDLVLPFGRLTTSQLYTGLLCVAIPLGFLASPISTMMWLIGASGISIFSHAAFMEKPIETIFEEQV
ncbi:Yip3 protein [Saccharomycopsis crataegensis]|uniref:PRA1 family protein n=1 Tax=Saccharomycopsis crataegensis TaxID=43959 RepID=A0AAV5QIS4_9ASCO|nr:Yip3 protein [Saccharomycopsis crataegensis]